MRQNLSARHRGRASYVGSAENAGCKEFSHEGPATRRFLGGNVLVGVPLYRLPHEPAGRFPADQAGRRADSEHSPNGRMSGVPADLSVPARHQWPASDNRAAGNGWTPFWDGS